MSEKVDIWMPLYIGDYLADTSHLDAERHGCYLLWMMHYWRKGPLSDSLEDLISIGRLRSSNASSIAQALLGEFFTKNGDGLWHQKRQDRERERWIANRSSSKEKAKKAAAARWKDDASSNAPSTPQAMLGSCPLSLPLPIKEQIQIPSRKRVKIAPTKTDLLKEKRDAFKMALKEYWKSKNSEIELPWGAADGKNLGIFMGNSPDLTVDQFKAILRNRYRSEVNHAQPVYGWIIGAVQYLRGPLNDYNKPINGSNGHVKVSNAELRQQRNQLAFEEAQRILAPGEPQ